MKATIFAAVLLFWVPAALAAGPSRPPITSVSHLSVYDGDAAKAEAFYVHDLGAVKKAGPGKCARRALLFLAQPICGSAAAAGQCRVEPDGPYRLQHRRRGRNAQISGVEKDRGAQSP